MGQKPNGTGVWTRTSTEPSEWVLRKTPLWEKHLQHVVDDKWAELRKAYTDGKTIQIKFNIQHETDWEDQGSVDWTLPIEQYRIKPTYEWQWILKNPNKNEYFMTDEFYSTTEELVKATKWLIVEKYKLSRQERKEQ